MGRALLLSLALGAPPAFAGSCAAPSLADAVRAVLEAPEGTRRHLLDGRLDVDPALLPPLTGEGGAEPSPVPARFGGVAYMPGALALLSGDFVALTLVCGDDGCGRIEPRSPVILLAEQTPDGYVAEIGPCAGAISAVGEAGVQAAAVCIFSDGADCEGF